METVLQAHLQAKLGGQLPPGAPVPDAAERTEEVSRDVLGILGIS